MIGTAESALPLNDRKSFLLTIMKDSEPIKVYISSLIT